jgi:hypothetical protein
MFEKLASRFMINAIETGDFKDSLEYHVEKMQSVLVRLSFRELVQETKKEKLNCAMVSEFRMRHTKKYFTKRYMTFYEVSHFGKKYHY